MQIEFSFSAHKICLLSIYIRVRFQGILKIYKMAPNSLLHFSYIVAQTQAHIAPTTTTLKLSDVACESQYIHYTLKINMLQMFIFRCLMGINDIDITLNNVMKGLDCSRERYH